MKKNLFAKLLRLTGGEPQAVVQYAPPTPEIMEKVLLDGNLSVLTTEQRLSYYESVCRSVNLNPLTKPFEYINLNGKLTLYARKDCTDQLRRLHGISISILSRELGETLCTVTARATMPSGRCDESLGSVPLPSGGEARANAMMKAETKAKRRATLSICGLGIFDESEIDSMETNDAQSRVETATANRLKDAEEPITEDNFGEVVCHIGQANGEMLGKKVSEIHPKVLEWLRKHYGSKWGSAPTLQDARLKQAVDFAIKKLEP